MRKTLIVLACLVLLFIGARSVLAIDTSWYPSTVAIGLDARSLGMGGAGLAVIDSYLGFYNPASYVYLSAPVFLAGRFVYPEIEMAGVPPTYAWGDQTDLYLAYLHPKIGGTKGAYGLVMFQDQYVYMTVPGYDLYHSYTGLQYGYGYALNDWFSIGFNIRQVATSDDDTTSTYFGSVSAADLGVVVRVSKAVTASVLVTDINAPRVEFTIEGDDYFYIATPRILFGGAIQLGEILTLALDIDYSIGGISDLYQNTRAGIECRPFNFLAIRGGFYHGQPTVGFGLRFASTERMELCLDFGQFWPEVGEGLGNPVQAMTFSVYL